MIKPKNISFYKTLSIFIVAVTIFAIAISAAVFINDKNDDKIDIETSSRSFPEVEAEAQKYIGNSMPIYVGALLENIDEVSFNKASYTAAYRMWFKFSDTSKSMVDLLNVYGGTITNLKVISDTVEEGFRCQIIDCTVTASINYCSVRFPLETHNVGCYFTLNVNADKAYFVYDGTDGVNMAGRAEAVGYKVTQNQFNTMFISYDDDSMPFGGECDAVSALSSITVIKRVGIGTYMKCFIALFGAVIWVLGTVYMVLYHGVDSVSLIPSILYGGISNILVGVNIMPQNMQFGLFEIVSTYNVMIMFISTLLVITIQKRRKSVAEANLTECTRTFIELCVCTLIFNVITPLLAV